MQRLFSLSVALLVSLLAGCQGSALRPDPAYAAARPAAMRAPQPRNGAIYQAGWDMRLWEDTRARMVGDILTVELTETTNATSQNSTTTSKESSISQDNPTLLGSNAQFGLPGLIPLADRQNLNLNINQSSTQEFTGNGTSNQSNSLTGFITVTVVEVLPNRNLVVRGEKLMNLNRGQEHVRISGIVRPQDISADNVVASNRIGNVGISYSGSGEVADASVVGWLSRFFMSGLWPF